MRIIERMFYEKNMIRTNALLEKSQNTCAFFGIEKEKRCVPFFPQFICQNNGLLSIIYTRVCPIFYQQISVKKAKKKGGAVLWQKRKKMRISLYTVSPT